MYPVLSVRDCITGGYKDDLKDGEGILVYSSGDRFEGHWSGGLREGPGKYFYANGDVYEGTLKDDQYLEDGQFYPRGDD